MLENARSTAERNGDKTRRTSLASPAKTHADDVFCVPRRGDRRLAITLLAICCLVAGAFAGSIVGVSLTIQSAHSKGACAAIRMAAAHGYLDGRQQRIVMRALTTAVNPDMEFFPRRYREVREVCENDSQRR